MLIRGEITRVCHIIKFVIGDMLIGGNKFDDIPRYVIDKFVRVIDITHLIRDIPRMSISLMSSNLSMHITNLIRIGDMLI